MGPLPAVADLDAATLVEAVARDKKVVDGTLHFVLSPGIGQTQFVNDVSEAELLSAARVIGLRG
jgi:3-dehydroquinate synthetase